jgi:hypothetical protein
VGIVISQAHTVDARALSAECTQMNLSRAGLSFGTRCAKAIP